MLILGQTFKKMSISPFLLTLWTNLPKTTFLPYDEHSWFFFYSLWEQKKNFDFFNFFVKKVNFLDVFLAVCRRMSIKNKKNGICYNVGGNWKLKFFSSKKCKKNVEKNFLLLSNVGQNAKKRTFFEFVMHFFFS